VGQSRATADAELAQKAAELVPDEMLNMRADVLVECAEVLRRGGDQHGAEEAVQEAAALYERKGNLAAIALISG
jgi:hypothetical protein